MRDRHEEARQRDACSWQAVTLVARTSTGTGGGAGFSACALPADR
jgi:hypothetical protein